MTKYLTGVLTAIAAGVLLVAYALLGPRATASVAPQPLQYGQPVLAYPQQPTLASPQPYSATPVSPARVSLAQPVRTVETVELARPSRVVRTPIHRPARGDWRKTAMMIGGSSAAGAGLGAIFGGKKGALIGAAIGGGASTLYETTK